VWAVFWIGWLVAAFSAKRTVTRGRRGRPVALLIIVIGALAIRVVRPSGPNDLMVSSPVIRGIGAALVLCGLGIAVWARVILGRNWGMPMSEKEQPQLVTAGPYGLIRHPIYSGIVLATIGTALAVSLGWLVPAAVIAAYFGYSATVEERMLTQQFPDTYPGYRARTKMLIPFVL
jgi:protein-S-isoprenylcysteine O-methyltransferase Ste14